MQLVRAKACNKHSINAEIKAHILDDEVMKRSGFTLNGLTDNTRQFWLYEKELFDFSIAEELYFRVFIPIAKPDDLQIEVIDNEFGEPFDYQHMLMNGVGCETTNKRVYEMVEEEMAYLQEQGVLSGHIKGDYI